MKNEVVIVITNDWAVKHEINPEALKELNTLLSEYRMMTVKHFIQTLEKDGVKFESSNIVFTTTFKKFRTHTKSLRCYFEEFIDDYVVDADGRTLFPYSDMEKYFKQWFIETITKGKSQTIRDI